MNTRSVLGSNASSNSSTRQFIGRRTGKVFEIKSYDDLFSDSETDASLDITRTPGVKEATEELPVSSKDGSFTRPLSAKKTKNEPVKKSLRSRIGRRTGKDLFAGKKKLQESDKIENFSDLFSDTDDGMSLHPTPERVTSSASMASCEDSDIPSNRSMRSIRRKKSSQHNRSFSPVMSLSKSGDDETGEEDETTSKTKERIGLITIDEDLNKESNSSSPHTIVVVADINPAVRESDVLKSHPVDVFDNSDLPSSKKKENHQLAASDDKVVKEVPPLHPVSASQDNAENQPSSGVLEERNPEESQSNAPSKQTPTDLRIDPVTSRPQPGLDFGGTAVGSVSNADKVLPAEFFGIKKRLTFSRGVSDSRISLELSDKEASSFRQRKSYPGSFLDYHSKDTNKSTTAALVELSGNNEYAVATTDLNTSTDSTDGRFRIVGRDEVVVGGEQNSFIILTGKQRSLSGGNNNNNKSSRNQTLVGAEDRRKEEEEENNDIDKIKTGEMMMLKDRITVSGSSDEKDDGRVGAVKSKIPMRRRKSDNNKSQSKKDKSVIEEVVVRMASEKMDIEEGEPRLRLSNDDAENVKSNTSIKKEKGIKKRNGERSQSNDASTVVSPQEEMNEDFHQQAIPTSSERLTKETLELNRNSLVSDSPRAKGTNSKGSNDDEEAAEVRVRHSPSPVRKKKTRTTKRKKNKFVVVDNEIDDDDDEVLRKQKGVAFKTVEPDEEIVDHTAEMIAIESPQEVLKDKESKSDSSPSSDRKGRRKRSKRNNKKEKGLVHEDAEKEDAIGQHVEIVSDSSPVRQQKRTASRSSRSGGGGRRLRARKQQIPGSPNVHLQPMAMLARVSPQSGVSFRRKSSFLPSLHVSMEQLSSTDEAGAPKTTPKRISHTGTSKSISRGKRAILNDLSGAETESEPVPVANADDVEQALEAPPSPAMDPEPSPVENTEDNKRPTPQASSRSKYTPSLRKRAILESARMKGLRANRVRRVLAGGSPVPSPSSGIDSGPGYLVQMSPIPDDEGLGNSTALPSPSSSPVHYAETTTSGRRRSSMGEALVLPDLSYKIIQPEKNSSGLRRSRRTRVQRLNNYKGEGVVYKRDSGGFRVVHSIMPSVGEAKVLALDRKRSKKRIKRKIQANCVPAKTRRMSHHIQLDALTEDSEISVINPDTQERVFVELVSNSEEAEWVGPDLSRLTSRDSFGMSILLNQPSFCSGEFHIRPLCEKPRQITMETMVYFLISGKVCVSVNNSSFIVENRNDFFVPRGSVYKIKNLRKDIAQLKFLNFNDSTSTPSTFSTPAQ